MTVQAIPIPTQGQLVDVRRRRYAVVNVTQSLTLPTTNQSDNLTYPTQGHHLVTLSSVEDDAMGEELQVIWEIEPGAKIVDDSALPESSGFDPPERLDSFLNAVRWGSVVSATENELQAPFRSGVDQEVYQLDPLVRAVEMPRVNLLIADDVGLGKTIEAGLVCQELIIRHRVRKVLIVCPAALQVQWRDQMRDKFGLDFRIVDNALLKDLRRSRGLHVNPWTHFPRLITSIDFLKRSRPLRLFTEALPDKGASTYPRRFDLLILDEAHNVAPSGQGNYAVDSQRTNAIRHLAPHFEHKLFLSATPHNGYPESFTSLLELLDNQRFARGINLDNRPEMQKQLQAIMVRRLKSEMTDWANGNGFAKREIYPIDVSYTDQERNAHHLLQEYTCARLKNTTDPVERYASMFVFKLLKKRLFSSPEAFAITLDQHRKSLTESIRGNRSNHHTINDLRPRVDMTEEESDNDDELEDSRHLAVQATTPLFHPPTTNEQALLIQLQAWAEDARKRPDSKTQELIAWLHREIKPDGKWSQKRVILFTEYRATQRWLQALLSSEGLAEPERLSVLYGGMDTDQREEIKAAFQTAPERAKVRILLATDAASEGIDLQNHCSHLIHYEIPWNPNRLEQRNGRIDRHGQQADEVSIYHFASSTYRHLKEDEPIPTDQLEGDLEFLARALTKVEAIRQDLGKVGPVIATQVEEAMLGKRFLLETKQAEAKDSQLNRLSKFEKSLNKRMENLDQRLLDSRNKLKLTPENIQAAVETALAIAGKPPLRPAYLADAKGEKTRKVFYLPTLTESWASCKEGLYHPFTKEERPVVFDPREAGKHDDVVLAHLNHRLVSRCLRLLRTAVWSADTQRSLHHITARTVPSSLLASPAIIAHARLIILGGDSQRLHEELICIGGRITNGKFVPLPQHTANERTTTENTITQWLNSAENTTPSEAVKQQLKQLWPEHQPSMTNALKLWSKNRYSALTRSLEKLEERAIHDIIALLQELRATIEDELYPKSAPKDSIYQQELWKAEEQSQYRKNRQALHRRLDELDYEQAQEIALIKERFKERRYRIFPISITYLVPQDLAN